MEEREHPAKGKKKREQRTLKRKNGTNEGRRGEREKKKENKNNARGNQRIK